MLSFELPYKSSVLYKNYCDLLFIFAKQNPVSGGIKGMAEQQDDNHIINDEAFPGAPVDRDGKIQAHDCGKEKGRSRDNINKGGVAHGKPHLPDFVQYSAQLNFVNSQAMLYMKPFCIFLFFRQEKSYERNKTRGKTCRAC
jgi:hypothetical protein